MIINDIIEYLTQVPPFIFLDRPTLKRAASKISIEFYPKGTEIMKQDGPPSEFLYIIKKGGVKIFIESTGNEIVIDYRSEGDCFGFISLYGGDRSNTNVIAIEDTICYLLGKKDFFNLHDSNPTFAEYFLKSYLGKDAEKAFGELFDRHLLFRSGTAIPYTTSVGQVVARRLVTESPMTTIRSAAKVMARFKISSLVITDEKGNPLGIVTDRDLREKVVANAADIESPVGEIMTSPLITIEENEYCFEALLRMIRYNIHHIIVMDKGKIMGILTNHDIMMLQGKSPIAIARDIENKHTIESLVPIASEIVDIIGFLFREGAKATSIARIITELNDILVRKIIRIKIRELGAPPVPFCWIVFGSEGRKEQTFRTDQDNALIYANPPEGSGQATEEYFAILAQTVTDSLIACGFAPCPAGYMANNKKWRQPLKVWRKYFADWITSSTPDAILLSTIFFDFRYVYGDFTLADQLRSYLLETIAEEGFFLARMGAMLNENRPPLGFFRAFVVEKDGEHKDQLNLKVSAIAPLVDMIRLFSLEKGVSATSTLERIEALKGIHDTIDKYDDELEQSFEFMMLLRMLHQLDKIELSREPDNFINPNKLSALEKQTLRGIFRLITHLQDHVFQRYRLGAGS